MTSQEKMELIQAKVIESFNSDKNFDMACAKCVGTEGITFTEIGPLVKKILIDANLIVTKAKRIEHMEADVKAETEAMTEFADFKGLYEVMAEEHDLPKNLCKKTLIAHYKENEWDIPKENALRGVKLAVVECFKNNPECSKESFEICLRNSVKGPDNAKHYSNQYYEMARQLVNIGLK